VALSPTNATHTLSMVRVSATRYAWDLISNATGSLQLTEPGGVSTVICRAYHKLEELFETNLASSLIDFSAMHAFDVGAAPGGWTDYLRHRCASVVAVDPGELHHSLHGAPNVTHMQMTVERAVPTLREAGASVDMLLCDMNLSEDEALPLLAPLIELMPRGAWLVFTLKYCGRGCRPESIDAAVQRLVAALAGPFDEFRTYWLWVNSLRERTIVARRTALPGTFAERKVTAATPKALAAVAAAAAARAAAPAVAPRSVSTWASTSGGDSAAAVSLSDAPIHETDDANAAAAETATTAAAAVGDSQIKP
jgi:hypothetical protein